MNEGPKTHEIRESPRDRLGREFGEETLSALTKVQKSRLSSFNLAKMALLAELDSRAREKGQSEWGDGAKRVRLRDFLENHAASLGLPLPEKKGFR